MKPKFDYDDIVRVHPGAPAAARPGERAWVVGILENGPKRGYFDTFPPGVIYLVEFEDGSSTEVHEDHVRLDT